MAEPDETSQKYEPLTGAKKAQYEADMRLAEREAEKKKKQTLKEFEDALAKAKASPPLSRHWLECPLLLLKRTT